MKLTINTRNMSISPAITKRIEKKTETMGRYLWPETEMQVKMRKEKNDKALAKMERQIRKHRTKLGKNLRDEAFAEVPEYIEEEQAEEEERKIVKRKTFPVRPMSVEDAAIEMELLGHSFFAFINIDTDRTNVLYLRKDGNLGLLEPEA